MTAQKKTSGEDTGQQGSNTSGAGDSKRKAWVKRSPIEVILQQVKKQEEKVADLKKDLEREELELKKMQTATKALTGG